jgi:hypothetical protein
MKSKERHAIPEIMESDSQCGGRRALLLMHRLANRAGLGDGARYVKQEQHGKIASAAKAVEVHGLVRHRSGHHLHAYLDRRVDIDVVALNLPVATIEADAKAGERST